MAESATREIDINPTGENPQNVGDNSQVSPNKKKDVTIINMSNIDLSAGELSILMRGLKFTPTPKPNKEELKADISHFNRKMRLSEFFVGLDYTDDGSIVRNKSSFTPGRHRDAHLDRFVDHISNIPLETTQVRDNLNKTEREAIKSLINNDNIVIKESDKGSSVCVMNAEYYQQKIMDLLCDTSFYVQLPDNADSLTMIRIRKLVKDHSAELTPKEQQYLTDFEVKTSNFYGLPKVHKSTVIINEVNQTSEDFIQCKDPLDLKFRPIVAGPSCATHRLSNFIDILLRPYIQFVKSYVRDDIDFLTHLPETIKESSIFVSFDVTSLYTNISHELGIRAISYWLDNYTSSETNHSRISKQFILDGLKLILENNTFQFNRMHFKQISGTAMGTKMAPTFATLVLGFLEKRLYSLFEEHFGSAGKEYLIENFKRFLDDVFCIWDQELYGDISVLCNMLNSLDPNIKFTIEIGKDGLAFLDIMVKRDGTRITTDLFYKPTDSKLYLDFHSCHPRNTKINVPYNLARRICTICLDTDDREFRLQELKEFLTKRHYPVTLINAGILKAKGHDIAELRQVTHKAANQKNVITFVHEHNPTHPNIFKEIKNSMSMLQGSTRMKDIVQNTSFISSKKQPKNLKHLLTRAAFDRSIGVVSKCESRHHCGCCDYIITGSSFFFHRANKTFNIKTDMNCGTKNLLYVLVCKGCDEYYIGQTGLELRNRLASHKSQIKHYQNSMCPVSEHINFCAKKLKVKFKIMPFFKIHSSDVNFRLAKESYMIESLKSILNA